MVMMLFIIMKLIPLKGLKEENTLPEWNFWDGQNVASCDNIIHSEFF